jgi:hypothetical protein
MYAHTPNQVDCVPVRYSEAAKPPWCSEMASPMCFWNDWLRSQRRLEGDPPLLGTGPEYCGLPKICTSRLIKPLFSI